MRRRVPSDRHDPSAFAVGMLRDICGKKMRALGELDLQAQLAYEREREETTSDILVCDV